MVDERSASFRFYSHEQGIDRSIAVERLMQTMADDFVRVGIGDDAQVRKPFF